MYEDAARLDLEVGDANDALTLSRLSGGHHPPHLLFGYSEAATGSFSCCLLTVLFTERGDEDNSGPISGSDS